MNKLPISVFIITKNEEKNIARALESVSFASEVIVVDSGSYDRTIDIVKSFGVEPVHHDWRGYAMQKQFALELCNYEWVLNIDADEEVSEELIIRLAKVIEDNRYTSVRCLRTDVFMGKVLSKLTKRPTNRRFYKKSCAHFDSNKLVHESASVEGDELLVTEPLVHYGYATIDALSTKNNHYSSLKSIEKHRRNVRFSYAKLCFIFPIVFIQQWIFKRKIFSGVRGFILSVIEANYAFIKEAKLYELRVKESQS